MQIRQMPGFGRDSTIDPRLGDAPAASCFLPPPSRPTARIPAPSSMSSFADNRSSDAARAIGMQLCTVSIVEEKVRIPLCGHLCPNADDGERTSPSERTVAADAPPGFTHRLNASPTST
jgi:hypothetical protein